MLAPQYTNSLDPDLVFREKGARIEGYLLDLKVSYCLNMWTLKIKHTSFQRLSWVCGINFPY